MVIGMACCKAAIQNLPGLLRAKLQNMKLPSCISFTTIIVCFASVILIWNKSFVFDAWEVPADGGWHKHQWVLANNFLMILLSKGERKLQPLEYLNTLPGCLMRRHIITLQRQKGHVCYRSHPTGYSLEVATPCGWHIVAGLQKLIIKVQTASKSFAN